MSFSKCQEQNANSSECSNPNQSQLINWISMKSHDLNELGIMTSQGRTKWWKGSLRTQWKLSLHLHDPIYNVETLEVIVKTNHCRPSENCDNPAMILGPFESGAMQTILGYARVSLLINCFLPGSFSHPLSIATLKKFLPKLKTNLHLN